MGASPCAAQRGAVWQRPRLPLSHQHPASWPYCGMMLRIHCQFTLHHPCGPLGSSSVTQTHVPVTGPGIPCGTIQADSSPPRRSTHAGAGLCRACCLTTTDGDSTSEVRAAVKDVAHGAWSLAASTRTSLHHLLKRAQVRVHSLRKRHVVDQLRTWRGAGRGSKGEGGRVGGCGTGTGPWHAGGFSAGSA